MRHVKGLRIALVGGAVGLMALSSQSFGAVVVQNGDFESPTNTNGGTDTACDAWTLSPCPNPNAGNPPGSGAYTNNGQRCTFANPTPSGGTWSFWEQTFTQSGNATQTIASGVTAGTTYTMTAQMAFEVNNSDIGSTGFNSVTLANQPAGGPSPNTGDLYSYLGIVWLNVHGATIGSLNTDGLSAETTIPAGTVTTGNHVYSPYSLTATAPAGAVGMELVLGWNNGGVGTGGGQSAFATDVTVAVPEPASLSMLGLGLLPLLRRRRQA